MATASDVPGKFDVVINGTGYLFSDQIEESLPFRVAKATYSYSPTFVERQNVQGNYGDDTQSFWQTASQNDWTGGEDQKFFRANDESSRNKFFRGTAVDVRVDGQVSMRDAVKSLTAAAAPQCSIGTGAGIWFATTTNLYLIDKAGTITDKGAHGLGVAPASPNGIASDGVNIFLSSAAGGTVGVRRYDGVSAFSTFSATGSNSLAFLNNTLYGFGGGGGVLRRYDTAGAATTLFTFLTAVGGVTADSTSARIFPYGGKLVIFRGASGSGTSEGCAELWIYDGVGVSKLHAFEPNFYAYNAVASNGVIFLSGTLAAPTSTQQVGVVYYFANGTPGLLWRSVFPNSQAQGITTYDGGLVWIAIDSTGTQFMYCDLAKGSVQRLGASTVGTNLSSNVYTFLSYIASSTSMNLYPDTVKPTSSTITTSLFDFDSSLDKRVRGVKVDFTAATDGDGGSVDVAYQLNALEGSFTSLATGVTAGTEIPIDVTCRSISLKITLNKGTSTNGPVFKRSYVRAAPILQQYKIRQYVIACFGDPAEQGQTLRDGSTNTKSGREMADALITAVTSATPISITDRFSTYTAILEPVDCELHEIHANPLFPATKSGSFIARVTAREV